MGAAERACMQCGRPGLNPENTTGRCWACYRALPQMAKAARSTDAGDILRCLARKLADRNGLPATARMMGLDAATTLAVLEGRASIVAVNDDAEPERPSSQLTAAGLGLPADHPLAGVELDPALLAEVVRRARDLQPLPANLAVLLAPWQRAMRIDSAKELPGERTKRRNRAKARAGLTRYVPPVSAPLDPNQPGNALGCDPRASHLPQHRLPMRVAVGLWALGFGAGAISKIAARARRPVSKSVVHRMLARAERRFDGAVRVRIDDLACDMTRPRRRGR